MASRSQFKSTTDHDEIRQWAEARGRPAVVKSTRGKGDDTEIWRIDFLGCSGSGPLEEISWEDFFEKFDREKLALVYQDTTARGQKSNFNKIVSRETVTGAAHSRSGAGKSSGGAASKTGRKRSGPGGAGAQGEPRGARASVPAPPKPTRADRPAAKPLNAPRAAGDVRDLDVGIDRSRYRSYEPRSSCAAAD